MIGSRKAVLATAVLAAMMGMGSQAFAEDKKPEGAPAAAAVPAAAGEPNTLSEQEKAAGWKLLFDGKAADGLRSYNKPDGAMNDKWKVKDGALGQPGGGGDIITKEQFGSFEFSVDYRISKGGNSGLMFFVIEAKGEPPYMSGPEIQIQDNVAGHDPQKAGWLYQLYTPANDEKTGKPLDATKPAGEWNTLKLTIDGGKGVVTMNGVKYEEFEVGSADWNERLAKSKFAKWPRFAKEKQGHIALQDHGDEVAFRNIKVREIKR